MRLHGVAYRAHEPRFAFAPTSGDGAAKHGGRFNPVGVPALYLSLSPTTALKEVQQGFAFKPVTLCAYAVDCTDIVDLTDPKVMAEHGADGYDLACAWLSLFRAGQTPPTWALATDLIAGGAAGAILPSFAPDATTSDRNVVFWRWGSALPHQVIVTDDDARLPRNDLSWR